MILLLAAAAVPDTEGSISAMGSVFSDQDHHGNRIVNADLTGITPEFLHPEVLTADRVVAGAGIVVGPGTGGGVVVSAAGSVAAFRERFQVDDPLAQEPLRVVHGLGSVVVSVTVAEIGDPTYPVNGLVTFVDEDTVEVLLTGESAGEYEVLVLSDGGAGGGAGDADARYVNVDGDVMRGTLSLSSLHLLNDMGGTISFVSSLEEPGLGSYIACPDNRSMELGAGDVLYIAAQDIQVAMNPRIRGVADPEDSQDVATKKYVDDLEARVADLSEQVAALSARVEALTRGG